jgi:hypothetical protein
MIGYLSETEIEKLSDEELQTKLRGIFNELANLRSYIDACTDHIIRLNKIKAAIEFYKLSK